MYILCNFSQTYELYIYWLLDDVQLKTSPSKNQFSREFRQSTRIRRDTMKEMLCKEQMLGKEADPKSIVSTIPPSRLDGFMNGLNMLMIGKGSCYQVNILYRRFPIDYLQKSRKELNKSS